MNQGDERALRERVRVVYLNQETMVDVLNWMAAPEGCCLSLPASAMVPAGAVVLNVFAVPERQAIGCLIAHESFDRVPRGMEPRAHAGAFDMVCHMLEKAPPAAPAV